MVDQLRSPHNYLTDMQVSLSVLLLVCLTEPNWLQRLGAG
jgi:hypothetical protein